MSKRDYYDVLGLAKNASDDDIKKAYRKMASKYHPDKVTDESEKTKVEVKFKEAKEAYETLSDGDKRADYDSNGFNETSQFSHRSSPKQRWDFSQMGDMQNVFDELLKRHEFTQQAQPQVVINIALHDAYTGRSVTHNSNTVVIPKGVRPGTKIYVGGTMYRIEVQAHNRFKRALDDLMVEVTISAVEAMLGVEAVLEHLDNSKLQFSIPSGIQNGQIVKLSKTGMKNPETDHIGDMLVRISITTPKLSDMDKTLLKNLQHRDSIII